MEHSCYRFYWKSILWWNPYTPLVLARLLAMYRYCPHQERWYYLSAVLGVSFDQNSGIVCFVAFTGTFNVSVDTLMLSDKEILWSSTASIIIWWGTFSQVFLSSLLVVLKWHFLLTNAWWLLTTVSLCSDWADPSACSMLSLRQYRTAEHCLEYCTFSLDKTEV